MRKADVLLSGVQQEAYRGGAPEAFGSIPLYIDSETRVMLDKEVMPADEHGAALGIGTVCLIKTREGLRAVLVEATASK